MEKNKIDIKGVETCDSGYIHGIWIIPEEYNGTIHNGKKAFAVYQVTNGLIDSLVLVYDMKHGNLLEERKFDVIKDPIRCGNLNKDSIKQLIAATDRLGLPIYEKLYWSNGLPSSERFKLGYRSRMYKSYYPDTASVRAILYSKNGIDSTAFFYKNGLFKGYEVRHDSVTITTTFKYSNFDNEKE